MCGCEYIYMRWSWKIRESYFHFSVAFYDYFDVNFSIPALMATLYWAGNAGRKTVSGL